MAHHVLSIDVGSKNLALCCVRHPGDVIVRWMVTATMPECHALVDTMVAAGVVEWLPEVREVVIERQLGRNGTMTRIQCYLEMFFTMHGKCVTLANPSHKLDFALRSPYWTGGVVDRRNKYARKKVGVACAREFLVKVPQSEEVVGVFETAQKRDDLADALFQALAHVHYVAPLQTARAEAKRARVPTPRCPNAKQLASGRLGKAHVVYMLQSKGATSCPEALELACRDYTPLRKAVVRHFGSPESCLQVVSAWASSRDSQKKL